MSTHELLEQALKDYERLAGIAHKNNYKDGWVYYKIKEKYPKDVVNNIFPPRTSDFRFDDDGDLLSADAQALKRNGMCYSDSAIEFYRSEKRAGRVC